MFDFVATYYICYTYTYKQKLTKYAKLTSYKHQVIIFKLCQNCEIASHRFLLAILEAMTWSIVGTFSYLFSWILMPYVYCFL